MGRHAAQLHLVRGAISRRRLSKAAPWRLTGDSTSRTAASPSGSSSPQMHPAAVHSFSIGGCDGECWLPTAQLFWYSSRRVLGGIDLNSTAPLTHARRGYKCPACCFGAKCCAIRSELQVH